MLYAKVNETAREGLKSSDQNSPKCQMVSAVEGDRFVGKETKSKRDCSHI